jgi:hypothetical protein
MIVLPFLPVAALASALVSLAASASPMVTYDARSAAMGGISVASGARAAPTTNPAILAYGVEFVDWYLVAPSVGSEEHDPDSFETLLDDFKEADAALEANPDFTRVQRATDALNRLNGATLHENQVASVFASVPSNILGAGVFFNAYSFTSFKGEVGAYDFSTPAAPVYNSVVQKRGVSVIEHGVSLAQVYTTNFRSFDTFALGFNPKIVLWQAVARAEDIESADTKARFGGSLKGSAFSMDVGLLREVGRFYTAGLTIKNLLPVKVRYPEPQSGSDMINTQVRAGIAYERRTRVFEADIDLVPNSGVGFQTSSRNLSIGGEFVLTQYLLLRAGLKQNLIADQESLLTFGLGIGTEYMLDIAVIGGADNFGATVSLAVAF